MAEPIEQETPDAIRAAKVRRTINQLIKASNSSTFDLAEMLHEAKTKNYYQGWGFDSFSKYAKSLEIRYTKSFYLVKIVENMTAAGLTREQYEPVGLAKLRIISRLDPATEYKGTPCSLLVRELTLKAKEMSLEEVQFEVETILGLTAEESMCWWNIHLKKMAREEVCVPALRKAKRFLGQQKDEQSGEFKDASDGKAVEMIMANFLTDPNFDTPDDEAKDASGTSETQPAATEAGTDAGESDTALDAKADESNSKYSIE